MHAFLSRPTQKNAAGERGPPGGRRRKTSVLSRTLWLAVSALRVHYLEHEINAQQRIEKREQAMARFYLYSATPLVEAMSHSTSILSNYDIEVGTFLGHAVRDALRFDPSLHSPRSDRTAA